MVEEWSGSKCCVDSLFSASTDSHQPTNQLTPLSFECQERKGLTKGGFRDKHFDAGSLLLGGGVFLGVAGPLNTFARTGKLFPGPHLYAGAGIDRGGITSTQYF